MGWLADFRAVVGRTAAVTPLELLEETVGVTAPDGPSATWIGEAVTCATVVEYLVCRVVTAQELSSRRVRNRLRL